MNRFRLWILIKHFIAMDFFIILSIKRNLSKNGKKSAAFQGLLGLCMQALIIFLVVPRFGKLLGSMLNYSIGDSYLTSVFSGIFVITLFLSLSTVFVFIEKNNESELFLSLPISGREIISSRMFATVIVFFISLQTIILPILYFVGYYTGKDIIYYVLITVAMILFNFESVMLSGIIILLFGRLIRKSKFFNRFAKGIYSLFMISAFVLYMIFTQSFSNPSIGRNAANIISRIDSILSKVFFFAVWPKEIVLFNDFGLVALNMLMGISFCAVIFFIFNKLSDKNYLEILRSASVVSKENVAVIERRKNKGFTQKRQSKFVSLVKREFTEILTTPTYLLQIVLQNVMLVVVVVIIGIQAKTEISKGIEWLTLQIGFWELILYSFAIGAILGLVLGLSSLTTSSVSREGRAFWIVASAPINVSTQVYSRICACQLLHFIFLLLLIAVSTIIYVFNPLVYISIIIGAIVTLFTSGALNMILGLINPNFDWKTPKEALNNGSGGISVFFSILINYGIYALMGFIFYFGKKNNVDLKIIIIADLLIVLVCGIISYILDYKLYKRLLKKL
ncbi:MAG: hypothetical protein PT934_05460 [Peptoniphilaceae bacterium]|uniref:putative ABC transporter permease subunit n=1 Tax=Parvimonas sp. TaxID=1944660 RepID=UPI0025F1877F|nr:hypothetical protein [Parvimonas sp.]MCI5997601.1 hypothetical protein [Parvimonas sp.]MDD7765196.1 hypothetical protein [Peptoniphilaceae bacterium]MDY3051187.1 hypothetical protein [Parvimonas sp.]